MTSKSLIQQDYPNWRRYQMTVSCHNCDYIPKVPHAGEIVTENGQTYQVMHNGVKVLKGGYLGDWMAQIITTLRGHHEPQEEKVFFELLKSVPAGSTMIELGAWWAYYSLWFQQAIPDARNILVEPDPGYREIGQANFALNGMRGEFIDAAISAVSRSEIEFPVESTRSARMVEQLSVDDLLVRLGIEHVEVLHADIQGAELDMLRGCAQSVAAGKIRFLLLSTHHHSISHDPIIHHRCLDLLKQYNAHIIAQHTVSESFSGDGLIVASFVPADRVIPQILITKNIPSNSIFREVEFDLAELQADYQRLQDDYNRLKASQS